MFAARPGRPPHPVADIQPAEFTLVLRQLRCWSGLTLVGLAIRHELLKRSTTSDYLRGARFPDWEHVHAIVTVCLTHRGLPTEHVTAELVHWQTAWRAAQHRRLHPAHAPADSSAEQPEDSQIRRGLCPALPAGKKWRLALAILTGAAVVGIASHAISGLRDLTTTQPG